MCFIHSKTDLFFVIRDEYLVTKIQISFRGLRRLKGLPTGGGVGGVITSSATAEETNHRHGKTKRMMRMPREDDAEGRGWRHVRKCNVEDCDVSMEVQNMMSCNKFVDFVG